MEDEAGTIIILGVFIVKTDIEGDLIPMTGG